MCVYFTIPCEPLEFHFIEEPCPPPPSNFPSILGLRQKETSSRLCLLREEYSHNPLILLGGFAKIQYKCVQKQKQHC